MADCSGAGALAGGRLLQNGLKATLTVVRVQKDLITASARWNQRRKPYYSGVKNGGGHQARQTKKQQPIEYIGHNAAGKWR